MLKSHIDAVENHLLTISKIPANAGHSLHKGTPREAFIKEFLSGHLSERAAIGTGEIIDAASKPNQQRNQFDIVIYKRDYPKLNFGGGISGFLAESVIATIEVKSTLDKSGINQSVSAAVNSKRLKKHVVQSFHTGYQPPSILNYVVAYDGPVRMETVHNWITESHIAQGIITPVMGVTLGERINVPSPSVDGVFILGKGFIHFDNVPVSFITDDTRAKMPNLRWGIGDSPDGNLLLLFLFLTLSVSGVSANWLDPLPYLQNFGIHNFKLGS